MGAMMPGMEQEIQQEMQQQARRCILLRMDDLQLMLPQGEVCAVESAADIRRSDAVAPAIGHIAYAGQNWPVLCLNRELDALDVVAPGRRACAMLATGRGFLGVLCNDVRVLNQLPDTSHTLPVAMRTVGTPIQSLMQFESGIACLSDMRHLVRFGAMAQVLQNERS